MANDPYDDADLSGYWARDRHRGGYGDDYAREYGGYREEGVNERLTDDPYVDASHIDVRVEDGVVHLSGRVRTRGEKRRADDIANDCLDVHDVMNAIRVTPDDREVEIGKASE